jgi:hypothetical protein
MTPLLRRRILAASVVICTAIGFASTTAPAVAKPAVTTPAGTYIVSFTSLAARDSLAQQLGVRPTTEYADAIQGFTARLTSAQASKLAADPRVEAVTADQVVEGQAQTIAPHVPSVEADKAPVHAGNGVGGWSGPAVAVIDSGVSTHPDINLQKAVNCFDSSNDATDANGHGTGVSGYMAAIDNGTGVVGVAPGAPIYSVRVMGDKNQGTISTVTCGLNWVLANHAQYNIKVVNMSLGTPGSDDGNCGYTNNDVMHQAICALVADGLTIVASAANEGTDLARYAPAAYDEVLAATNVADYDGKPGGLATSNGCSAVTPDDSPPASSNYAVSAADQAHTVASPGVCPYTTKLGNRYGYIQSGTSMSAAAVSGVVLDCFAAGQCTGKSVAQVRQTIIDQAAAAAARGHRFTGDPLSPIAGKYYGYEVSTIPVGSGGSADTTAPKVAITSPVDGTSVAASTRVVATATDEVGVTAVKFLVNGAVAATGTAGTADQYSATLDLSAYAGSTVTLTATASDAAGNTGTSTQVSVRVPGSADTVAPTISITSPSDGATVSATTPVTATATDDVGVTRVRFLVNGESAGTGAAGSGSSYTATLDLSSHAGSTVTLTATAEDAAGNVGTSAPVRVTVPAAPVRDTQAPTVSIVSPTNNSTVSGTVAVTYNAADNVAVTAVTLYSGSTKMGSLTETATPGVWSITLPSAGYRNGRYPLTAKASDAAGNVGSSSTTYITIAN